MAWTRRRPWWRSCAGAVPAAGVSRACPTRRPRAHGARGRRGRGRARAAGVHRHERVDAPSPPRASSPARSRPPLPRVPGPTRGARRGLLWLADEDARTSPSCASAARPCGGSRDAPRRLLRRTPRVTDDDVATSAGSWPRPRTRSTSRTASWRWRWPHGDQRVDRAAGAHRAHAGFVLKSAFGATTFASHPRWNRHGRHRLVHAPLLVEDRLGWFLYDEEAPVGADRPARPGRPRVVDAASGGRLTSFPPPAGAPARLKSLGPRLPGREQHPGANGPSGSRARFVAAWRRAPRRRRAAAAASA